jgi:hypothetical protein
MKASTVSPRTRLGFLQFYGWLGLPVFLVFLVAAGWTAMLAIIQLAPTATANYLMRTTAFDFGEFWLLSKPDLPIAIPAAVMLFLLVIGYVGLALLMLFPEKCMGRSRLGHHIWARVHPNPEANLPRRPWFHLNYDVREHELELVCQFERNRNILCDTLPRRHHC